MVKNFVEGHFNLVLSLSVVLGLVLPGLEYLPKSSALAFISAAIFFSCSRVSVDELRGIRLRPAIIFYLIRFVVLPAVIYAVAVYVVPAYAMGVFLVALAPVGASSTAVAGITRGNSSLALSSTVITNALAPFVMPILIFYCGGDAVNIDIWPLSRTLGLGILLPAFLYFGVVRRFLPVKDWVRGNAQFGATICIAAMMAAVTALEKDYILHNPVQVLVQALVGGVLFAVLYGAAWGYALRMSARDRRTYMVCSGVNNTGISTGLALLYFSPATILFSIVAEVPWTLGIVLFKKYADRFHE